MPVLVVAAAAGQVPRLRRADLGRATRSVEACTGLAVRAIAVCVGIEAPAVWALPAFLYLAAISIALALIDLDTRRLPNRIVLPSLGVGAVLLALASWATGDWGALLRAVIGSAGLFALYFVIAFIYAARDGVRRRQARRPSSASISAGWAGARSPSGLSRHSCWAGSSRWRC